MSKVKEFSEKIKGDEIFRAKINECKDLAEKAGLSIQECAGKLAKLSAAEGLEVNSEEIARLLMKGCRVSDVDAKMVAGGYRIGSADDCFDW